MPLHVELNAPIVVVPFEPEPDAEGKELLIPVADAGQVFHYKMTAELAEVLVKQLAMTNAELTEHHRQEALKESLSLPAGVDLSKLNGRGRG